MNTNKNMPTLSPVQVAWVKAQGLRVIANEPGECVLDVHFVEPAKNYTGVTLDGWCKPLRPGVGHLADRLVVIRDAHLPGRWRVQLIQGGRSRGKAFVSSDTRTVMVEVRRRIEARRKGGYLPVNP